MRRSCLLLLLLTVAPLCYSSQKLKGALPGRDDFIYFNFSCLAFFAREINMFINTNPPTNHTLEPKNPVGSCGVGDMTSLSFVSDVNSSTMSSVNISFGFASDKSGFWRLDRFNAEFDGKVHKLLMDWPTPPVEVGFKCSDTGRIIAVNSTPLVEFSFLGLQVQPFGITGGVFTEATDCVGFLSTDIFSNLIVIFLLLGILTYGLVMVMGIQTNDSFDDPKHKMIQIGGTAD